jgi:hypothetical protein
MGRRRGLSLERVTTLLVLLICVSSMCAWKKTCKEDTKSNRYRKTEIKEDQGEQQSHGIFNSDKQYTDMGRQR